MGQESQVGFFARWQKAIGLGLVVIFALFHVSFSFAAPKSTHSLAQSIHVTAATTLFSWQTMAPIPEARYEAQGEIVDGVLYIFSGFNTTSPNINAIASTYAYNIASNTWQRKADMPEVVTHAPTVATGNIIYLIGGYVGNHPGASTNHVWKYDTVANSWSRGPDLPQPRGASAAAIINNVIYVVAGATRTQGQLNDTDHTDFYKLDLNQSTPTWQVLPDIPMGRNHIGGAALNGKFYAIGGQIGHQESSTNQTRVDVFDPATNTWSRAADMPLGRGHISDSTFVVNGRIMVIGGTVNGGTGGLASSDVLLYDPVANVWLKAPSIPQYRKTPIADVWGDTLVVSTGGGYGPTSTTWTASLPGTWEKGASMNVSLGEVASGIIGNTMYVVGEANNSTTSYDLGNNTWASTNLAQRPYTGNHHAAEVINGKWYLFGGLGAGGGKVQIYNPSNNTWTLGADMPFAAGSSSSAVVNGKVYVAGGIVYSGGTGNTTNRVAMYDPATNTWTEKAPMPQGRNHAAAATDGGKLYIFGGRGVGSGNDNTVANGFDTLQIYDPATDTWQSSDDAGSTLAPLPQARGGTGKAVYYNGEFYIMGGETLNGAGATANNVYDRVDIYNPTTNTWRLGTSMPTARHGIFPILIGQRIYVAGGGTKAGYSNSTILEIYNPGGSSSTPPPTPTVGTPSPTATTTPLQVTKLTLINADTNQPVAGYDPSPAGAVIDYATLGTTNLNIRATTNPATVGSVRFWLDGTLFRTENIAPYAMAGDQSNGTDFLPFVPPLTAGQHTVRVVPYSASNAGGSGGIATEVTFTIVSGATATATTTALPTATSTPIVSSPTATTTPLPTATATATPSGLSVTKFVLINADTNVPVAGFDPILPGAVISYSSIGTTNINIRAVTNPGVVGSVRFLLDGYGFSLENVAPYAMAGDLNNGTDYKPFVPSLSVGQHTIRAIPYSGGSASGTQGVYAEVTFTINN